MDGRGRDLPAFDLHERRRLGQLQAVSDPVIVGCGQSRKSSLSPAAGRMPGRSGGQVSSFGSAVAAGGATVCFVPLARSPDRYFSRIPNTWPSNGVSSPDRTFVAGSSG